MEPAFLRLEALVADIDAAGRVFADDNHGEAGLHVKAGQLLARALHPLDH
jgi:hypothetical protein